MTAGKVLLLRHGQTDWNVALRLQGQSDIDLNEVGREQARSVAAALAALEPAAVAASDLSRARETAELVAGGLGLDHDDRDAIDQQHDVGPTCRPAID